MVTEQQRSYMRAAIDLGRKTALQDKAGGPFGCVIVKDHRIIASGANRVLAAKDPTCHGEMEAIRGACLVLGTHDLSGCDLYTSSEPCPMCYGAAWWARIEKIYYASSIEDARTYGNFDDQPIYEAIAKPPQDRALQCEQLLQDEMLEVWKAFRDAPDRPWY